MTQPQPHNNESNKERITIITIGCAFADHHDVQNPGIIGNIIGLPSSISNELGLINQITIRGLVRTCVFGCLVAVWWLR